MTDLGGSGGRAGAPVGDGARAPGGVVNDVPGGGVNGAPVGDGAGVPGGGPRRPFGARLAGAMDELGPLCVGIDPHAGLLERWGLPDSADGARQMGLRVVEEVAGEVAAVKPQSAFFERHGPAGAAALQDVLAAATSAGLLTILDVKRGDIGSTMAAYAATHLLDSSPLPADAITVSPYLGPDSLTETVEMAASTGRGVFALALTSNPEGHVVQHAGGPGASVAGAVVRWAGEQNRRHAGTAEAHREEAAYDGPAHDGPAHDRAGHHGAPQYEATQPGASRDGGGPVPGPVGLVVGATIGSAPADLGLDLLAAGGLLLAPGIGAQGAGPAELREVFGPARHRVLAAVSRSVLGAGGDRGAVREAALAARDLVTSALRGS